MFIKTKAIVLSSLKYQEKSLIVSCYTQSNGLKTFFIPNAFSSKKNNQKIAYFQLLTLLDVEFNFKNKGGLEQFKDINIHTPYFSIPNQIHKNTIAQFLSEVLNTCLNDTEPDDLLFDFLETALLWFDTHDDIANFHIMVLLKLTKFLGFYPDTSTEGYYFEMNNGQFVNFKDASCLTESETKLLSRILPLNFDSDQKIFTGQERQLLLKIILDYYSIHWVGFRKPKSLAVLKEIFA